MNSDNIEGKLKDLGGKAKQATGEATGNAELEGEGRSDQVAGKVQNAWGNIKKEARDVRDEIKGAVESRKRDHKEDVA